MSIEIPSDRTLLPVMQIFLLTAIHSKKIRYMHTSGYQKKNKTIATRNKDKKKFNDN